jgi:hypothetical protein
MSGHSPPAREPEPTEFNVILEGRSNRPIRIPSVWVRRPKPLDPEVRRRLVEILQAISVRATAEEEGVQPFIVEVPPTSDPQT